MKCPGCPRKNSPSCGSRGDPKSKLLIVGMAPGKEELLAGKPFVGGSGLLLDTALRNAGSRLEDHYVINTINCFPEEEKGHKISYEQWQACRKRFLVDVHASRARAVLPLGGDALLAVTGRRGHGQGISAWRGYVMGEHDYIRPRIRAGKGFELEGEGRPSTCEFVVPAYHPSFIMQTGLKAFRWLARDVERALRASRGELEVVALDTGPPCPPAAPSREGASGCSPRPREVSYDIETVGHTREIERIGLGWRKDL